MSCITLRDIPTFMGYDLNSIDEVVRELGGNTAIGEWLGIHPEAVSMWKARGQIATGWHLRIAAAVKRKRKSVNPSVFGLSEDEAQDIFAA